MRNLISAVLFSTLLTAVAGCALNAGDATLAVIGVAAVFAVLSLVASWTSTEESSGLATAHPGALVALTMVNRSPSSAFLPLAAAHAIGSVVGGFIVLGIGIDGPLLWANPSLVGAACLAVIVGAVTSWVTLSIEGGQPVAWAAVPAAMAGAIMSPAFVAVGAMTPLLGLAIANVVLWKLALLAVAGSLIGTVIGTYATRFQSISE